MHRVFVLMLALMCFSLGCDQAPFLTQLTLDDEVEIDGSRATYHLDGTKVEIDGTEYELTGTGYIDITLPSDDDETADDDSGDTEWVDPDPPVSDQYPDAHFVITATSAEMRFDLYPSISITIKNIGNKTGYGVACDVYAKKGTVIVDTAWVYFASGNNIKSGESTSDEAIFDKLDSHDQYDTLEYDLTWRTRQ